MASSPPFQVDDQTDEDFFDKLVNDDDEVDFKVTATTSKLPSGGTVFVDRNDSDDVKAFMDLTINEANENQKEENKIDTDDASGGFGEQLKGVVAEVDDGQVKRPTQLNFVLEENKHVLQPSNSLEFNNLVETSSENTSDVLFDTNASKSSGSGALGVKEVQWSAFNADSAQNDGKGFGSYSDFLTEFGGYAGSSSGNFKDHFDTETKALSGNEAAYVENPDYENDQGIYNYGATPEQNTEGQDLNSSQYWESLYPGWKFDHSSGQWYQVDGYAAENIQGATESNRASDGKSEVSYLQQTTQFVGGTVHESGTTESVINWNKSSQLAHGTASKPNWGQVSQVNDTSGNAANGNHVSAIDNGYPSHMIFDPQYPGWYYDTIAQEWQSLDSYCPSQLPTVNAQQQPELNKLSSTDTVAHHETQNTFDQHGLTANYSPRGQDYSNIHQGLNMWQQENPVKSETTSDSGQNQLLESRYSQNFPRSGHVSQQQSNNYVEFYDNTSHNQIQNEFSADIGLQRFVPKGNFINPYSQPSMERNERKLVSHDYYNNQNPVSVPQQQFQGTHEFAYASTSGRSSAGRPPHALVTFGFGGKLIVTKENSSLGASSFGSQNQVVSSISVLNLMEVVRENGDASSLVSGASDYFCSLRQQSFPGPLTGGGSGVKELNRWIDERTANSEYSGMDFQKVEGMKLLLSLLKISCQYYGKLRSPFGSETGLKENDTPEAAVARLFASAKRNTAPFEYGVISHCLQKVPSEREMLATAAEVQSLLVSGRKIEALHCAQEGHLWGPALVLAAQLGDQFYVETVKQMALRQLVAGSPLRTLCLLIAGQPADVFSLEASANNSMPGTVNIYQQPSQFASNGMLDGWEENLAVITANRTKDDELVLIHLGDCLWKDKSDVVAAHICYLVAEANFEPYSDTARLCLVGADHWKFPRTYASPEAIQRTETFEYSKVLGNSQFILLSFQPYKLVYAHMLAEVGRISDALKYCQSVQKSLKTGRAPEVETLKALVSSLEERIKTHQQGGFSANLAPGNLVGKLLNLFDSTAHRVVGTLPPPSPSTSGTQRVSTSQSTLAMSSLVPSSSMEPVNEWAADSSRMTIHSRSVSEPNFGRTPLQDQEPSKEVSFINPRGETSGGGGTSRFSGETSGGSGTSRFSGETSGGGGTSRISGETSGGDGTSRFSGETSGGGGTSRFSGKTSGGGDTSRISGETSGRGGTSRFSRFNFGSQLLQKTIGLVVRPKQDKQAKLGEANRFYYDEKLKRWVEEGAEPPAAEIALPPPPTNAAFQNGTPDCNLKTALTSEVRAGNSSPEYRSPSVGQSLGIPPLPPMSNQYSARGRVGVRSRYVDTFNQGGGNQANLFQSPTVPSIKPSVGANTTFFVPASVTPMEETAFNNADIMQDPTANNGTPSSSILEDPFISSPHLTSTNRQRFGSMDNISYKETTCAAQARRTASWSGSFDMNLSPLSRGDIKPSGEVLGMPSSSLHSSANGDSLSDELHDIKL